MMHWQKHENDVAKEYGGRRTIGSGNTSKSKGDVILQTTDELIECKYTRQKNKSRIVRWFEKITDQAYEEGKEPVLHLRFYDPDSPLSRNGNVDLTVRLTKDDIARGNYNR